MTVGGPRGPPSQPWWGSRSPRCYPPLPDSDPWTPDAAARDAHLYLVCDVRDDALPRARRCAAASTSCSCGQATPTTSVARRRRGASRPAAPPTARCSSSTTGPTWSPTPAPTASTSARTTRRSPARARARRPERLVGLSTHTPAADRRRRATRRRLHRRRTGARDPDQARPTRGRHRARPPRRAHAPCRSSRSAGSTPPPSARSARRARRDRRRPRDHRGRRPRAGGARAAGGARRRSTWRGVAASGGARPAERATAPAPRRRAGTAGARRRRRRAARRGRAAAADLPQPAREQVRGAATPRSGRRCAPTRPGSAPGSCRLDRASPPARRSPTWSRWLAGDKIDGQHPAAAASSSSRACCSPAPSACGAVVRRGARLHGAAGDHRRPFTLFLIEASNLLGVSVALAIIVASGYLFWKLVRVLSRLQMPRRPSR